MTRIRLDAPRRTRCPPTQPEGDGTLAWTSTTLVLVRADADGHTGIGWTYGPAAVARGGDRTCSRRCVADLDPDDVPARVDGMRRRLRNAGRPGVAGLALSAAGLRPVGPQGPPARPAAGPAARHRPPDGAGLRQRRLHHLRRRAAAPAAGRLGARAGHSPR